MFLFKIDNTDSTVWGITGVSSGRSRGYRLLCMGIGEVAIAGSILSTSSLTFAGGTVSIGTSESEAFVLKLNDVNECASNPCLNGGLCNDGANAFTCTCPANTIYTTPPICGPNNCASFPCASGSTCLNSASSYACVCAAGFSGLNCQTNINECVSLPCLNGGNCTDGINSYQCTCFVGFSPNRQCKVDYCLGNTCTNGATCANNDAGYVCQCIPGYSGVYCQTNVDECASIPCQNSGTCTDGLNAFACACTAQFNGTSCGSFIPRSLSSVAANRWMAPSHIVGVLLAVLTTFIRIQL